MNGSESNEWILYIQEWVFPVLIFITLPFVFGMLHTKSDGSSFPSLWAKLWAKLLANTITYALVLFAIVWIYSEPKPLDMEAYKNGCIFILLITCGMCATGHYIGKTIWLRYRSKKFRNTL
jgi:hypothetical protein